MYVPKYRSDVSYVLFIAMGFIFTLQNCCSGKYSHLINWLAIKQTNEVLYDNPFIESCPLRGAIRLQNGANKFEGRVEVCGANNDANQSLIWKIVCNAGWDRNEATVICRQLRFSGDLNCILKSS